MDSNIFDEADLAPENYPDAARVLTEDFYWDCTNEFSPFGNDDGADTLSLFQQWRAQNFEGDPVQFLDGLLKGWEVANCNWDFINEAKAVRLLNEDEFGFRTRDNCIIAVAFGQILLGEKVDGEIKRRALLAIERQLLPAIMNQMLSQGHLSEFTENMTKMKSVLVRQ